MVEEYNEDAAEEQMEDQIENQHEIQSDLYEEDTTPSFGVKDDLWTLFKWVVAKKDSTKIANLMDRELGMLMYSVRGCQDIALQARYMKHIGFQKFWIDRGENILASSLSRNMAQQNLFVSQTKKKTTEKRIGPGEGQEVQGIQQPKKRGFFKRWGG